MSGLMYTIQSSLPSVLGQPSVADIQTYSNSGFSSFLGSGVYNAVDGNPVSDAPDYTASALMNHVWILPMTDEIAATQNIYGMAFLPWNETTCYRVLSGQTTPLPVNPWDPRLMPSNGLTVLKLVGVTVGSYYGFKYALRTYKGSS